MVWCQAIPRAFSNNCMTGQDFKIQSIYLFIIIWLFIKNLYFSMILYISTFLPDIFDQV